VVRANREWVASVTDGPLTLTDAFPEAYQLLIGDESERPELGVEPKLLRTHAYNFARVKQEGFGGDDLFATGYTPKFRFGVCIADRDAFTDFIATADTQGLPELGNDPGSGDWLVWWSHTCCPATRLILSTIGPPPVEQNQTQVFEHMQWRQYFDIRSQRRIRKDQCILACCQWVNPTDVTDAEWDLEARMLVTQ